MRALQLKVPPALLMVIFMALMWVMDQLLPVFKQPWAWHERVALGVFTLAMLLVVAGIISFRLARTTVDPTQPEKATAVVTTGVYRLTRNPMYLGFLLVLLAFVVKLANPITLIMLPLFIGYMNQFQIKPEEQALTELFGQAYEDYLKKVRRWV
jgi:protein-S-isoprenylcysteine O-methyltransferase Ste14